MWKNIVELGRPRVTIRRMRIACWTPTGKNTHTVCIIIFVFPLQQWKHKHASTLRYTHIACLVILRIVLSYKNTERKNAPFIKVSAVWLPQDLHGDGCSKRCVELYSNVQEISTYQICVQPCIIHWPLL
jgi:hypothetical protein